MGTRFRCPPQPDPLIRRALLERIRAQFPRAGAPRGDVRQYNVNTLRRRDDTVDIPSWTELFALLLEEASERAPFVLILDDAHRLSQARSRFEPALGAALKTARARQIPFHVVIAGRAGSMPQLESGDDVASPALEIRLGPLPLRAAAPHLPGTEPFEKIRAYTVFGGSPGVLTHLDTSVTVGTNVRRLFLSEGGALTDVPMSWLERSVQTPTRYVATLEALAWGEAGWSEMSRAIPDLTKSGQVAPYLKRLSELGFVHSRRSLDAPPRSRSTRYALTDPFMAFWLRFVLPWLASERDTEIVPYYATFIRPGIREHVQQMLPAICRRHMEVDALETLGSNARDSGSIWNSDVEIPVVGTLGTGATYYGTCLWDPPVEPRSPTPLQLLDRGIRETRYGFGRERRIRLVFTGRRTPTWLRREAARHTEARVIDAPDLLGDGVG